MEVVAAPLTDEGGLLRQAMKAGAAIAFRAAARIAESNGEQVRQADVVGRKSTRKLPENFGVHWLSESRIELWIEYK